MRDVVIIEKVTKVIPNKYEAIRVMAKEARRINEILMKERERWDKKPTSVALERLLNEKIRYDYVEKKKEQELTFSDEVAEEEEES